MNAVIIDGEVNTATISAINAALAARAADIRVKGGRTEGAENFTLDSDTVHLASAIAGILAFVLQVADSVRSRRSERNTEERLVRLLEKSGAAGIQLRKVSEVVDGLQVVLRDGPGDRSVEITAVAANCVHIKTVSDPGAAGSPGGE